MGTGMVIVMVVIMGFMYFIHKEIDVSWRSWSKNRRI